MKLHNVNLILKKKVQSKLNDKEKIYFQEVEFDNDICKMWDI